MPYKSVRSFTKHRKRITMSRNHSVAKNEKRKTAEHKYIARCKIHSHLQCQCIALYTIFTIIMDGIDKRWCTIKLIAITAQFANSITHTAYRIIYFCIEIVPTNEQHWLGAWAWYMNVSVSVSMSICVFSYVCHTDIREKSSCFSYCSAAGIFYLRIILLIQIYYVYVLNDVNGVYGAKPFSHEKPSFFCYYCCCWLLLLFFFA